MNLAKQLFRKLLRLNLWLHAGISVLVVVLLFALPVPPSAGGFSNVFVWLLTLGCVFLFGIGHGHPSLVMKLFGGAILVFLAVAVAFSIAMIGSLFVRLLTDQTRSRIFRTAFSVGVLTLLLLGFARGMFLDFDELASNAIFKGDLQAYERAARWRQKGDIDRDLYGAARWGQLELVKYFLEKGANPNAKLGGYGDSILSGAIPNVLNKPDHNLPVVDYLRQHGATN